MLIHVAHSGRNVLICTLKTWSVYCLLLLGSIRGFCIVRFVTAEMAFLCSISKRLFHRSPSGVVWGLPMWVPEAPVYYGMAVSEANPRQALLNVEDIGITLLD